MPRPSNTAERRAQIIDALLVAMSKHGYDGASVAAIAREAKLAPGLIHYHFETKQQILVALVERLAARVQQRYLARLDRGDLSARHKLDALIDAHLSLDDDADPRAVAAWNVIGAEALRQSEVRALYTQALETSYAQLKQQVGQCLRDAGKPARHAGRIASGLLAAIEGAFRVAAASHVLIPRGSATGMVKHMADGMLAAEADA